MQLTGKQIVDNKIIYGHIEDGVQQQGVDVRVIAISRVVGQGYIPVKGKTIKCQTEDIPTRCLGNHINEATPTYGWTLDPGYYEVTFAEGCKIPADAVLHYDPRSSLVRCGGRVFSGQFDGGFETSNMGCFMELVRPVTIEQFARIAQAHVVESYPVAEEDLYDGQWQNDKQRIS